MWHISNLQRLRVLKRHLCKPLSDELSELLPSTTIMRNSSSDVNDDVLFEEKNGAKIITLNRPKALNALNLSMIRKIYPKIKEWEEDPHTTMIIMKGSGGKAFCAGGDIRTITDAAKMGDYKPGEDFFRAEYQLNYRIATCFVPYIAFIDGITMGGGVGLSVHGENRVCTEKTVFAMPEMGIGLFPDVGGSHFLPRLSMHLGMFLALTGYRLKGRDVYRSGVATRMVDSDMLPQLEQDLIALETPSAQDITDLLRKYHEKCQTGRKRNYLVLHDKEEDIKRIFLANSVEEIIQNLRKENTEWANEQLNLLRSFSPTSLKIAHQQLKLGESLPLDECLEMEFRLSCNCLRNNDFPEGVRALLVDKDKNPRWKPDKIEDVTDSMLNSYFKIPDGVKELEL